MVRPALFITGLFLMLGTLSLTSCTVKTGSRITKVNPYHLQPGVRPSGDEQSTDFEYRRKVLGAVTAEDYKDRYGNYYSIYWKIEDLTSPVTVRLQYLQAATGPKIFMEEQVVESPKRSNSTYFEIIGDQYAEKGAVTQWKASIIQNGSVVDEFKSFLWQ